MGYIHCCGGKRKTRSYVVSPERNYLTVEADFLEECPVCRHCVLQVTRLDFNHDISILRKTNDKARKLFDKIKCSILFEKITNAIRVKAYSSFYLYCNEFGKKKKCYSNLSTLKMGLFDNIQKGNSFNNLNKNITYKP